MSDSNRRLLIIDDNPAIHEDFRKILCRVSPGQLELSDAEASVFGDELGASRDSTVRFEVDSAFQGEQGIAAVRQARADGRPYAVAFVDVRMPPGLDGVETAARLFAIDPDLQIVICTAFSDYSWEEILAKLGRSDRLMVLKKPFDTIEVLQLTDMLAQKWQRAREGKGHLSALQQLIRERSRVLHGTTAWLAMTDSELAMAAEISDTRSQQLVLEDDLRRGLEAAQFSVRYQPLVEMGAGRVVSVEALARWAHPERGWISPEVFIPVAEQSGLILELGEFVLRTACEQVARWQRGGMDIAVAVNMSAVQLRMQNALALVRGVLGETGVSPRKLVLEITESVLIENLDAQLDSLRQLRADGVGIAIDDFGTGYSSLSYLQRLPAATLKIDRTFVRRVHESSVDASIVQAITAMAHALKMNVVAEGVETAAQMKILRTIGCDAAQGFLFAPPLAAGDCTNFLKAAVQGDTSLLLWPRAPLTRAAVNDDVVNL